MSEETRTAKTGDAAATGGADEELPQVLRRALPIFRCLRVARSCLDLGLWAGFVVFLLVGGREGFNWWHVAWLGCGVVQIPLRLLQASLLGALAYAADMRSVGPLLEAASAPDWPSGPQLNRVLVPLLNQMHVSDYARLSASGRRAMHQILTSGRRSPFSAFSWFRPHSRLRLAILGMLQQCGGEECIASVAYLASRSQDPEVEAAAEQCLEYLQARLEEERPTAKLLRPAEAPEEATLLRPAQASRETPEEQLLRPATPGDDGVTR